MKIERAWSWLVVALGLAACPSSEGPMGGDDTSTGSSSSESSGSSPPSTVDTTAGPDSECGNGAIEDGEECDGFALGGVSCTDVDPAYSGGALVCGESCTFDVSGCELPPLVALMVINELTSEGVLAGDFAGPDDAIELHNAGTAPADLSGWQLTNYTDIPPLSAYELFDGTMLDPGDFLVLRAGDLGSGRGGALFGFSDSEEETLTLLDDSGELIDRVTFDGDLARESYCRVPDGDGPWLQCVQTFGSENQQAGAACGNEVADEAEACDGADLGGNTCESLGVGFAGGTLMCTPTCKLDLRGCSTDGLLVLNELSSLNNEGIEIFNGGDAEVDLSGWVLTDNSVGLDYDPALDAEELVFPAGTVLGSGEYRVVSEGDGNYEHPFGLGAMGDRVTLLAPSPLTIIDQVSYESDQAVVSWCRLPNGPGGTWNECMVTFGAANLPQ
jgi:hypothetical protein